MSLSKIKKYPIYPVRWPETDSVLEAAIGRVIIAWSVLDLEIDEALRLVLRCSNEVAPCVTANLGTQAKLDIFASTIHTIFHIEESADETIYSEQTTRAMQAFEERENTFVKEANAMVAVTRSKASEFRNWLAHGQPRLLHLREDQHHWIWVKQSARRGGVTLTLRKLTPEPFEQAAQDIRSLVDRWHEFSERLPSRLDVLDRAEAAWRGDQD